MLKKLLCALAILTVSTTTQAATGLYLAPTLTIKETSSDHSKYTGLQPSIALGYAGLTSYNTYLAGEVFATPLTLTFNDSRNSAKTGVKTTRSYGASLIPGYFLTGQVMMYLRLGAIDSVFSSPNTSRWGGQIGLGLQGHLTESLDCRGEYVYTKYRSLAHIGSVHTNQIGLGLVYSLT